MTKLNPVTVDVAPATGEITMTSIELVDFINSSRSMTGKPILTHANFMKKVREVFQGDEVNFYSIYKDAINREKPMYTFPKREATLMAMSYSHKVSAQVFAQFIQNHLACILNKPFF